MRSALRWQACGSAFRWCVEFASTGLVPRLPTAVLATGLMLVGVMSFSIGLVLDTVTKARRETKRLAYLAQAPLR